jgi:SAM-dependent methyltransferase
VSESRHSDLILDQFTRQAVPFSTAPAIKDEAALRLVVEFSGAGPNDTVLDVACGPGLLVCAFARVARSATGIDLTPAMIERARALQREQGLNNVSWQVGDVQSLPCADGAFSLVTSRFAFHHLLDPRGVLAEMKRVCAPGGRVVVIDSAPDPAKADAFNHMETLRDPSHVRAMPLAELTGFFSAVGLPEPRVTSYRLEGQLEGLLSRSFPQPGDADEIRRLFRASIADDALGIATRLVGDEVHYGYPVAVLVADRRVRAGRALALDE